MPSEANLMLHACKLARAGGVGLTAIMIVIAGLPQLACACPGKSGPSVPTAGATGSACACGRCCCASAAKQQGAMSCCPGRQPSSSRGALAQKSCKVSVAAMTTLVAPSSVKAGVTDETPALSTLIAATPSDASFRG